MPELINKGEIGDDNVIFTSQLTATPYSHWYAKRKIYTTTSRPAPYEI